MLRGELNLHCADELRQRVGAELDRGGPIVIELAGLEFSDLDGVRALERLVREAERREVEVEVHGARGQVAEMIARAGLEAALVR